LGRFLQRDPAGYVDGMSLYEFVGGRSTLAVDPLGLFAGFDINWLADAGYYDRCKKGDQQQLRHLLGHSNNCSSVMQKSTITFTKQVTVTVTSKVSKALLHGAAMEVSTTVSVTVARTDSAEANTPPCTKVLLWADIECKCARLVGYSGLIGYVPLLRALRAYRYWGWQCESKGFTWTQKTAECP